MKENKAVGPNLKTYYYYTNDMAEHSLVKGVIVLATGSEGSGKLYDEIGDYLGSKGYALYAIDELGYGKTGEVSKKTGYKNWKKKDGHFAAYNLHALSVLAKHKHGDAPVYLIGNDFGAMLSLYLIKEFPEVIDKVITIGWGKPYLRDYGLLFSAWLKKIFLYDDGKTKASHRAKNRAYRFRFERGEKYAWLTSDFDQLNKIKDAGYIDTEGTIGHYYHYYKFKVKTPMFTFLKKCDKATPILLVSGDEDLSTVRGRKTEALKRHLELRRFSNVSTLVVSGRHQLFFESNRFEVVDAILNWIGNNNEVVVEHNVVEPITVKKEGAVPASEEIIVNNDVIDVEENIENSPVTELQEAEDELLISARKEEK